MRTVPFLYRKALTPSRLDRICRSPSCSGVLRSTTKRFLGTDREFAVAVNDGHYFKAEARRVGNDKEQYRSYRDTGSQGLTGLFGGLETTNLVTRLTPVRQFMDPPELRFGNAPRAVRSNIEKSDEHALPIFALHRLRYSAICSASASLTITGFENLCMTPPSAPLAAEVKLRPPMRIDSACWRSLRAPSSSCPWAHESDRV
jgi:hypothetical protein